MVMVRYCPENVFGNLEIPHGALHPMVAEIDRLVVVKEYLKGI